MSTTILSDPIMVSTPSPQVEIVFVKCECCSLTEECTPAYIERVRERYLGNWICGLCAEAVKYEIIRNNRLITTEEAITRHMNVCNKFRSSGPPPNTTIHLISAMRQLFRKSMDLRRELRSAPASPSKDDDIHPTVLVRSESCFPELSGGSLDVQMLE